MAYVSDRSAHQSAFGARIGAYVTDMAASLKKYRLYRTTLSELRSLSDREMNDLGLNRTMLTSVAYEAVYKA